MDSITRGSNPGEKNCEFFGFKKIIYLSLSLKKKKTKKTALLTNVLQFEIGEVNVFAITGTTIIIAISCDESYMATQGNQCQFTGSVRS